MHRDDSSKFLLYIEPPIEERSKEPVEDEITKTMDLAFSLAKEGSANYSNTTSDDTGFREGGGFRGFHVAPDGKSSSNHDYLLENGFIVNSLCTYYIRFYRNSIGKNDMRKLNELVEFYKNRDEELQWKEQKGINQETGEMWLTKRMKRAADKLVNEWSKENS